MTDLGIGFNAFTEGKAPSYPAIPLRGLLPVQRRAIDAAIETCLVLLAAAPKVQSFTGQNLELFADDKKASASPLARVPALG